MRKPKSRKSSTRKHSSLSGQERRRITDRMGV